MDNFKNLYEFTKTVRFELKPSKDFKPTLKGGDIKELINQFQSIQENFLDIFIYKKDFKKDHKIVFKEKREIKYGWLRSNTKQSFYDWKEKNNKNEKDKDYLLAEVEYLPAEFLRWMDEWEILTNKLDNVVNTKEEEQKRKSEIAFVLREFSKRQNFHFIQSFVNSVTDIQNIKGVDDDKKIIAFKKLLSDTYANFKSCEQEYLPAQSGGVLLHKASLNYYTLNKTPKEYENLKSEKERELYEKLIKDFKNKNWTLDEAYQKIKVWKTRQKSDFIEAVAGDKLTTLNFRKKFPLFDSSDENFEKFYQLTKELDNSEGEKAKKIAQQRGSFFNKPKLKGEKKQDIQTKNYYELCELFKRVAMKRGKIIAEIKGIENEEVQSQLLDSWAVVTEEGQKKSVIFVPRENKVLENGIEKLISDNHKKAHEFIENNFDKNKKEGDLTLYHFKSLTLRALEKLCFKERYENTFMPEIKKEIKFIPKYKEEWYEEKNHWKLIKFYQQVLQTQYVSKNLDLVDFGDLRKVLDKKDFKNLQEFESALEKACYVKIPLKISEDQKNKFIANFNAKEFEITTRSIVGNKKENAHAKIWKEFWSDENKEAHYTISRLNPEMSVFYRKALDKSEGNRNRYSKPRLTLATTITLNPTKKKTNLAFKTTQDIKGYIDEFNLEFNKRFKKDENNLWYFGIDRGLKELATLNVVKFSDKKNEFGVSQPKEFAKIPVYKLKDEELIMKARHKNGMEFKAKVIDNISYFVDERKEPDKKLFEKNEASSLDLTQAKLIKGHIILNGDKKTYLKLKELSAKRRIFELFSTSRIDKDAKFTGKNNFMVDNEKIYFATDWQKKDKHWDKKREEIKSNLKKYLENLNKKNKFEDIETIERIDHLRDAITANMVGIIFYLQNILGMKGFIGLENLDIIRKDILDNEKKEDKKMIEEHLEQSNEDISRRLEWALFRKFATVGCVPPQIKESILLRDNFAMYQFGILKFVKVGGTSSNCPNCGEMSGKSGNHFVCKFKNDCDFSSKENRNILEQNLNNSDEVAAYNIAKNAFDDIY